MTLRKAFPLAVMIPAELRDETIVVTSATVTTPARTSMNEFAFMVSGSLSFLLSVHFLY